MAEGSFVDEIVIGVRGGKGGNGAVHFARFKYEPKGGPDGGDGGDGGCVFIVGSAELDGLEAIRLKGEAKAGDGADGASGKKKGRRGKDLVLSVPLGTLVYDAESSLALGEITIDKQRIQVARGGQGGRGNARFSTGRVRAPQFAEKGKAGENRRLNLRYRVYAPIALIEDPYCDLTLLRGFLGGDVSVPHRFFQRPRVLCGRINYDVVRVSFLPFSIKFGRPVFYFLNHCHYAHSIVVNSVGVGKTAQIDALWPALAMSLQKTSRPHLRWIYFLGWDDPGLPYEVRLEDGNDRENVKVEFVQVPWELSSFDSFWSWVKENLCGVFRIEV